MTIETVRFGQVEVEESSIVRMPRGLLGFEEAKQFCLIQHRPGAAFRWLQCMTQPDLAFVVIDATDFFEDYDFELSSVEADYLGIKTSEDTIVLTLVSLGADGNEVTANLLGPIVVNTETLVGIQVVLDNTKYGTKHLLTQRNEARVKEVLARAA